MTKEELENCIENWFCDAECDSGMFGVAELYALIFHDANEICAIGQIIISVKMMMRLKQRDVLSDSQ